MKLPTENASKGDEQPVAESGGSGASGGPSGEGGAASGHQAPVSSESSSESGANNAPSSTNNQSGGREGGNPDVDFSEYLWMENEEEFDSQVLQELEDEEMINYYYELYEASLNENGTWGPNTANIRVTGPPPPFVQPPAGAPEDDAVDSLAQGLGSHLTLNSRLNPEAAEFVPRTPNMSSPN